MEWQLVAAGNISEGIPTRRLDELGRLLISLGQLQDALRTQANNQRSTAELKDRDSANQIARRQRIEQSLIFAVPSATCSHRLMRWSSG